jgi:hypothetical protein
MPPKVAESVRSSVGDLPPLDDLEAELKLKHSRKATGDMCSMAGAAYVGDSADAVTAAAGHVADDMGASAVARALAASGRLHERMQCCSRRSIPPFFA